MNWNSLSPAPMNFESSEIESLLQTPATLPLSAKPATTPSPSESSTRLPENAPDKNAATEKSNAAQNVAVVALAEAVTPNESVSLPAEKTGDNALLSLIFSPAPDAPFQSSMTLDLFCASPTAQIRYALGASTVDEHGMLFDSKDKIFLTQTTLVAARAFENGAAGPLISARFEIQKPQWQELEPTDQNDATPHQSSDICECRDGWKLAAASVRGKLHAHRALWREDSFMLADIEAGDGVWSVITVSDGAGSAPLSRVGSRLACAASVESLRVSLAEIEALSNEQETLIADDLPRLREALVRCGTDALAAIRQESQAREKPLTAFAATLLVLARREWNGSQLCAALQVGDGAIALLDANGVTLLGEADHGQHSSETRFLTTGGVESDLASRVKFSIKNDLVALAVISDGVSDDYFPEEKRLGEVFEAIAPLMKSDNIGEALVKWLGYEKKGSSDDRTLVMGWPVASGNALPLQMEASDGELQAADGHAG